MAEKRRLWTQEELIVVFNLYLKMPFGQMNRTDPRVIKMAQLVDRTPSSIAMRLGNFASVDPYHINRGIKGLQGGMNQVKPIFELYSNDKENFTYESELLLAKLEGETVEHKFKEEIEILDSIEGKTVDRLVKTRVNQSVFRKIVLNNYEYKCAISGIDLPELLVASHIVPWAKDEKNRMNPCNGISLNNLYDNAFDRGFISFDNELKLILSNRLTDSSSESVQLYFKRIEGAKMKQPERFVPSSTFLDYHRTQVFIG
ncbi:MAG: putative restriction endonuclease [Psychroserpens sp.]|jgi:putative restriction endonuclease